MESNSSSGNDVKAPSLTAKEIDKLLSMTLIANLATLGEDDTIHIVPMWFIRLGNDIGITTVKAIIGTVQEFTSGISAFLLSIAIVSLIVGAVGIITTLYTSVIERTREIGTMKAIGAKSRHILALFLSEALIVGIFGATFGLLGGIVGAYILSAGLTGNGSAANSQQIIPIFLATDMARVWLISTGLSILAGLFPALKASRLLPVAALKRE